MANTRHARLAAAAALALLALGCCAGQASVADEADTAADVDDADAGFGALVDLRALCARLGGAGPAARRLAAVAALEGGGRGSRDVAVSIAATCRALAAQESFARSLAATDGRELQGMQGWQGYDADWWNDIDNYYVFLCLVLIGVGVSVVFILEVCVFQTTLFHGVQATYGWLKGKCKKDESEYDDIMSGGVAPSMPRSAAILRHAGSQFAGSVVFQADTAYDVWEKIKNSAVALIDMIEEPQETDQGQPERDVIEFSRRDFSGLEVDGYVNVTIERRGPCQGRVTVLVRTVEDDSAAGFKAKAKVDFEPYEDKIEFQTGDQSKTIRIKLLPTHDAWSPTRWFRISLDKVISGRASLGGPNVSTSKPGGAFMARVYILQEDVFPAGMPESCFTSRFSDIWILKYYLRERRRNRQGKFWRTLVAMCYPPVHFVVAVPLILGFMLDWAVDPNEGRYWKIFLLTGLQALSYLLLRSADVVQIRQRGLVDGCGQHHRRQLLSKLLMLDYSEQYENQASRVFYVALTNVEEMASKAYWQFFVWVQSILGLVLCSLVIFFKAAYKAGSEDIFFNGFNWLPALALVVLAPLAIVDIFVRRQNGRDLLEKRMEGEQQCLEVFQWLAENGRRLFAYGVREIAKIDTQFSETNAKYIKFHGLARDWTNDSQWVTAWLGAMAYCIVLNWAALRLYQTNTRVLTGFSAGDFVVLVLVFNKFADYLRRSTSAFVGMQQGAVSVRRVADTLKVQEQASLLRQAKIEAARSPEDQMKKGDVKLDLDNITFRNVALSIPDRNDGSGLGMMDEIKLMPLEDDKHLKIPLGKIVFLSGGSEAQLLSILGLIAKLVTPTAGEVEAPSSEWAILMPSPPTSMPYCTVKDDFVISGASAVAAENFSRLLGLDPDHTHVRLPPGKTAMLAMGRYMLRDPQVLLAMKPTAHLDHDERTDFWNLLLIWQAAGGGKTLKRMLEHGGALGVHSHMLVGLDRRTLVVAGEEVPAFLPPGVVEQIDVNAYLEHGYHRRLEASAIGGSPRESPTVDPDVKVDIPPSDDAPAEKREDPEEATTPKDDVNSENSEGRTLAMVAGMWADDSSTKGRSPQHKV